MKAIKKMTEEYEPTITDVLEAMQVGFARQDQMFASLAEGQDHLREDVKDINQRLTKTQMRVEDVAEMLEDMTEVVDENRDLIFEHGERITVLERAVA